MSSQMQPSGAPDPQQAGAHAARPPLNRFNTDRSIQDLADVLYEEETSGSTSLRPTNANDDLGLPPAYEEKAKSSVRIAEKPTLVLQTTSNQMTSGGGGPLAKQEAGGLSKTSRIIWPVLLACPVLAAGIMLYLVTNSDDTLRMDMSAVKVQLPSNVFNPLWAMAQQIGRTSASTAGSGVNAGGGQVGANMLDSPLRKRAEQNSVGGIQSDSTGVLGLSSWGWCLRDEATKGSDSRVICSEIDGWYDVHDLMAGAVLPTGSFTAEAFKASLLHGLSIHGLAMVATMGSIVPIGLHIWQRYGSNNPAVEAGWFQHGFLFVASVFSLCAFIIDKLLKEDVQDNLPEYDVIAGPATLLSAISSLLLFLSLLLSCVPVMYRYFSRQKQYISSWTDLENVAGPTPLPTARPDPEPKTAIGLMRNASRRFAKGTVKRLGRGRGKTRDREHGVPDDGQYDRRERYHHRTERGAGDELYDGRRRRGPEDAQVYESDEERRRDRHRRRHGDRENRRDEAHEGRDRHRRRR